MADGDAPTGRSTRGEAVRASGAGDRAGADRAGVGAGRGEDDLGTLSIFDAAREHPRRIALVADGKSHSFTDMATRAARTAAVVQRLPPGPLAFVARTDLA